LFPKAHAHTYFCRATASSGKTSKTTAPTPVTMASPTVLNVHVRMAAADPVALYTAMHAILQTNAFSAALRGKGMSLVDQPVLTAYVNNYPVDMSATEGSTSVDTPAAPRAPPSPPVAANGTSFPGWAIAVIVGTWRPVRSRSGAACHGYGPLLPTCTHLGTFSPEVSPLATPTFALVGAMVLVGVAVTAWVVVLRQGRQQRRKGILPRSNSAGATATLNVTAPKVCVCASMGDFSCYLSH
jgi:hypothetical protein